MTRTHMNHDDACEIATRSHEIDCAPRSEFGLTLHYDSGAPQNVGSRPSVAGIDLTRMTPFPPLAGAKYSKCTKTLSV